MQLSLGLYNYFEPPSSPLGDLEDFKSTAQTALIQENRAGESTCEVSIVASFQGNNPTCSSLTLNLKP